MNKKKITTVVVLFKGEFYVRVISFLHWKNRNHLQTWLFTRVFFINAFGDSVDNLEPKVPDLEPKWACWNLDFIIWNPEPKLEPKKKKSGT